MKHIITALIICSVMFGCSISEKRDRLSCLLEEHSAFKEVLEHYSNDSLKLKAACFLLKNLQYHKGYSEKEIEPLLKLYQIFGENDILYTDARDSIFKMYGNRLYLQPEKEIPDTQIDPQYLINNIDWAFKKTENCRKERSGYFPRLPSRMEYLNKTIKMPHQLHYNNYNHYEN